MHVLQLTETYYPPDLITLFRGGNGGGNDQVLESGDDGSCTVILDGSSSHDPDGYIRTWNWTSEDGRTLSSGPKLKLRLPVGNHRFTLTVADDDGAMSSDSVSIVIR